MEHIQGKNKNYKQEEKKKKKVFPWFCDKDLSSVTLLSKTHDFIKIINLVNKTYDFVENDKTVVKN